MSSPGSPPTFPRAACESPPSPSSPPSLPFSVSVPARREREATRTWQGLGSPSHHRSPSLRRRALLGGPHLAGEGRCNTRASSNGQRALQGPVSDRNGLLAFVCIVQRPDVHRRGAHGHTAAAAPGLQVCGPARTADDDVFYLFLQKQKIGAKLHVYL
jgi:hypothetical protein